MAQIEVEPTTTKQVVVVNRRKRVVLDQPAKTLLEEFRGDRGPAGPSGTPGPPGPEGQRGGVTRFYGEGPPGVIIGAAPNDEYLDTLTGDLYYNN